MDGIDVLKKGKELHPDLPVIMITAYSDIRTSVSAMRMGALDYLTKPLLPKEILLSIRQALEPSEKKPSPNNGTTHKSQGKEGSRSSPASYIFEEAQSLKNILKQVDLVAPTNYSVIIYGESGSGKEAIARELHNRSRRRDKPFVAIDCGALSKELSGSELFGHEKGAFTGALNQKPGSFEMANGGTVFLDEVSNLSYEIQVSLLRVIQERKMKSVGGLKDIELDIRIIVASNEVLWNAVRAGKFREDLYHRFNEFCIDVPPLRDRKEDILLFARHFLQLTNEELGKEVKGFTPELEEVFKHYHWYGNLRELKNVIKKATLLAESDMIGLSSLPQEIVNYQAAAASHPAPAVHSAVAVLRSQHHGKESTLKEAGIDAEYEVIVETLKKVNFNKSKAAKLLNIDRKTLYNKMSQYRELKNQ
ncbi:MAG TPA: sigma-54 dependent transcriptional regulator, partial [Chitinophagaceae bacterium]